MIARFLALTSEIANRLKLEQVNNLDALSDSTAIFDQDDKQLILHLLLDGSPNQLRFDLTQGDVAKRARKVSKSNEVIAKAIGCKSHYRPTVLDATAGMGRDSLMMAMLGCTVLMQERNFAIYHLLENALYRLQSNFNELRLAANALQLKQQDSIKSLIDDELIDVIYLDPMFPERKKSALVKKEMRLFKLLAGDDCDADELFISALQCGAKRVVVKRPKSAPYLCGKKPSHEIKSKNFRFDIYLKNQDQQLR